MKAKYTTLQGVAISLLANAIMPFFHGVLDLANGIVVLVALGLLCLTEE